MIAKIKHTKILLRRRACDVMELEEFRVMFMASTFTKIFGMQWSAKF